MSCARPRHPADRLRLVGQITRVLSFTRIARVRACGRMIQQVLAGNGGLHGPSGRPSGSSDVCPERGWTKPSAIWMQ